MFSNCSNEKTHYLPLNTTYTSLPLSLFRICYNFPASTDLPHKFNYTYFPTTIFSLLFIFTQILFSTGAEDAIINVFRSVLYDLPNSAINQGRSEVKIMTIITHPLYQDYPEQPYISPERDLSAWVATPELFPYGIVPKSHMIRTIEGVLPGDIIMLWRIHFNNFTNHSTIPNYFEYRYGVNSTQSIQILQTLGYITVATATDSLPLLNMIVLKRLLEQHQLPTTGTKAVLLDRIIVHIPEASLSTLFSLRQYQITPAGTALLSTYDHIIQKHGPKM